MNIEELSKTICTIEKMQNAQTNAIAYLSGLILAESLKKTQVM
ncbi:MAG: hypothetical protein RR086_03580 [Clostridia bacterium]